MLDIRTILITNIFNSVISCLVLLLLWRQSRFHFAGTNLWVADYALQVGGLVLIALRGFIWDGLSIVAANVLTLSSTVLLYEGLLLFTGRRWPRWQNYIILAAFTVIQWHYGLTNPSLMARNYNFSLGLLLICGQITWLLLRASRLKMNREYLFAGLIMAGFCLVSILRAIVYIAGYRSGNEYLRSGNFESAILLSYQMLNIMMAYALVLIINKSLEKLIDAERSKLVTAFRALPYPVVLSNLSDNRIIEANESLVRMGGYGLEEVIGRTTMELGIWPGEQDRKRFTEALVAHGRISGMELTIKHRSGSEIIGVVTAERLSLDGQEMVISAFVDVTESKAQLRRIEQQIKELKVMNSAMLDREARIVELKQEVNGLLAKQGLSQRYENGGHEEGPSNIINEGCRP